MLEREMYVVASNAEATIYERTGEEIPTPRICSKVILRDFGGILGDLAVDVSDPSIREKFPIGGVVNVILIPAVKIG